MPIYDYRCERCGAFRAIRPMVESQLSQACPACGEQSERTLSAPFLAGGDTLARSDAAYRAPGQGRAPWRHLCGFGCNHAR